MGIIGIEVPEFNEDQEIIVDVKINGVQKNYQYRVELFRWDSCTEYTEDKASCIKKLVSDYETGWDLAHIGLPNEEYIPITFKKKTDPLNQP